MKQALLATTAAVALALGAWSAAAQTDRTDKSPAPSAAAEQNQPAGTERSQNAPGATQQPTQANRPEQPQPGQSQQNAGQREQAQPGVTATQSRPEQTQSGQTQGAPAASRQDSTQPQPSPRDRAGNARDQREQGATGTQQPRGQTQPGQAQTAPSATSQQNPQAQPSQREQAGTGPGGAPAAQASGPAGAAGGAIPEQQRVQLQQRFASVNVHRVENVNFSLAVGTPVPRTVQLHPLPPEIVSVVPAYRGYRYIAVGERIAIVEPRTLRIVTVIEQSGVREGIVGTATPPRASVVIAEHERVVLRERIRKVAVQRAQRNVSFTVEVGTVVPPAVQLYAIPRPILEVKPDLRPYRYVTVEDQFVIVEPQARRVVAILPL